MNRDAFDILRRGTERFHCVHLVVLHTDMRFLDVQRKHHQVDTVDDFRGLFQHQAMVSRQVRFALRAVDDELLNRLALRGRNLDLRGERRAAHADDAGFADDGLQFLRGQRFRMLRRMQFHPVVLEVILDDDGGHRRTIRQLDRLNADDLAGDGRMHRCGHKAARFANLLTRQHQITLLHDGLAGRTDMLRERNHHARRRGQLTNGIAAVDGLAVYALMRMRSAGKHVFDKHRENPFPNPFASPAVTAENTYSDGIRLNRTQSHEIYYII